MIENPTIVVRSSEAGPMVCVVGEAGSRRFGQIGEVLNHNTLTLYARQAAEQGLRLRLEVQADGKSSWPFEGVAHGS